MVGSAMTWANLSPLWPTWPAISATNQYKLVDGAFPSHVVTTGSVIGLSAV
jgi:hypothetical protein